MGFLDRAEEEVPRTPLTDAIVRHRRVFYIAIGVFYLLAFTGQWRVGRDSALYRGLGHSLATGQGYHFGAFSSKQIYPGLPVLLAGLEKLFGPASAPPIILIHLFSLGCVILTYKLVRLRFPQWVAVVVACMLAANGWFLELTNEIRDDIPFLFGMLMALYGWERLRLALTLNLDHAEGTRAERRPRIAKALAFLILGLGVAAVMRPTFWILAVAWVLVCLWGLLAGPRRRFYAICLGILLIVWIAVALLDPRVRGFNPLGGGYERDFLAALGRIGQTLQKTVPDMIRREMAYAFFGQQWVWGVTELLNVAVILSSLLLLRRDPLWTLIVFITVAVTLLMTTVPRYYVMVVPLLSLSWLLLAIEIGRRVPHRWLEVVLVAGILMVIIPNLVRCCKVIGEQHHWNRRADDEPKWKYVQDMSEKVREIVPPGEKVIAPGASIMSYLSGREVVMWRDIQPPANKSPVHWPQHLAALNIKWVVFPSRLYKEGERNIRELIDRGVIVPTGGRAAKVGDMALTPVEVRVPPPGVDWRKMPYVPQVLVNTTSGGTPRPGAHVVKHRRAETAKSKRLAAQRRQAALVRQRQLERHKRLQAAARAAAKARRLRQQQRKAGAATAPSSRATPDLSDPSRGRKLSCRSVFARDLGPASTVREPEIPPEYRSG